jgi:uncharacterized protein with von Willebrand factor type A (vWA) domain
LPDEKFHHFINFGLTGSRQDRSCLARTLFSTLRTPAHTGDITWGVYTEALRKLCGSTELREVCTTDDNAAESLTRQILRFLDETARALRNAETPFSGEAELQNEVHALEARELRELWPDIALYLEEQYEGAFNADFFSRLFNDPAEFQKARKYVLRKWEELFYAKKSAWEEEFVGREATRFAEELIRTAQKHQQTRQAVREQDETGRLWNRNAGIWRTASYDVLSEYAELFRRDLTLQNLARALGRGALPGRATGDSAAPVQPPPGQEQRELCGIHLSANLNVMLPCEAALLGEDALENMFYLRLLEHKLLTYQMESAAEEQAQPPRRQKRREGGPFIVCVDSSGSMRGEPEKIAKSLVFALVTRALRGQRRCYLISFSSETAALELDGPHALTELSNFLSMSFYGGSQLYNALRESYALLEREAYRTADVLVVSDFILPPLDSETRAALDRARRQQILFHSVLTGSLDDCAVNHELLNLFDTRLVYDYF